MGPEDDPRGPSSSPALAVVVPAVLDLAQDEVGQTPVHFVGELHRHQRQQHVEVERDGAQREHREERMLIVGHQVTGVHVDLGLLAEPGLTRDAALGNAPLREGPMLRVAEVLRQDLTIENGGVTGYRVRLGISFKYESGD